MCMAFPCSDYYESSVLGLVRLRSSRLAQFRAGQASRVPVFRSSTLVPLGGELCPLRLWRGAEESRSHLECGGSHPPARNIEPRQFCSRYIASHAIARLGDVFGCRGVRRSLRYLTMGTAVARPTLMGASGTVKAALLMTLHRRHPIELCGPLPSIALYRGTALQPPVEDQQVWEAISKS